MIDQLIARQVMRERGVVLGLDDSRTAVEFVTETLATTEECLGEMALQAELRRFEQPDPRTAGQLQAANLTANVRPHTV